MILLDTHAWLWWMSDPGHLSDAAADRIETARHDGGVALSAISAWEAALLVQNGRLELRLPVRDLVTACARLPFFRLVPIDAAIAVASVELEGLHPDPADRLIVATARREGLEIVTKDERLHDWADAPTVW